MMTITRQTRMVRVRRLWNKLSDASSSLVPGLLFGRQQSGDLGVSDIVINFSQLCERDFTSILVANLFLKVTVMWEMLSVKSISFSIYHLKIFMEEHYM